MMLRIHLIEDAPVEDVVAELSSALATRLMRYISPEASEDMKIRP